MMDFETALRVLDEGGVKFVIVGGFAATAHGGTLVTRDLDVCYERTPDNLKRLAAALAPYHPRLRGAPKGLPFVFDERTLAKGMNFMLATDLGAVDLLSDFADAGQFAQVARDAVRMSLFGRSYLVVSLDNLIRLKRAAGRPKDLNSLPELEALKKLRGAQPDKAGK